MDDRLLLRVLNIDESKLLAALNREIEQLQAAKQELLARMNSNSNGHHANGHQTKNTASLPPNNQANAANDANDEDGAGMTRHAEFLAFLKQHGPCAMKDVVKGTGMPRGSASFTASRALAAGQVVRLADRRYDVPR